MKSMMRRTTFREIKNSFGRFMAIFAIIALGVGFFAGLKMTKPDMVNTVTDFLQRNNFYDLHLLSTLGYTEEDVDAFAKEDDVEAAEGGYALDLLYSWSDDNEYVLKTLSVPESVNTLELASGRLPENADECVLDSKVTGAEIGDVIKVSADNADDTLEQIKERELTVVGTVISPLYINFERGTTTIGTGKISGFVYVPEETFDMSCYTDVYVAFDRDYDLYSDEYDDFIDEKTDEWDDISRERVSDRYKALLVESGVPENMAAEMDVEESSDVSWYVLGRDTNTGYVCFESDSDIVDGVARVFPVFFILVAVLVCMTTMNRMVEEQRNMIGMLKALGYGKAVIMAKYMIYSGTAAAAGCVFGYAVGTAGFPRVIWFSYQLMYAPLSLEPVFDVRLALLSLAAALLCTVGTTWITCRYELSETAASLMRPKAPKAGKRVLLERIPFIWSRMKFLKKVSVRNIFRYKKRFFMMIIGISGCTALVLTGFGIKDSIADFASIQYSEIQMGDASMTLRNSVNDAGDDELEALLEDNTSEYDYVSEMSWELVTDSAVKTVNMVVPEKTEHITRYMNFHDGDGAALDYPGDGETIINNALADLYDISVGDVITVRNSDMEELELEVSGIFENHVYNYVYISQKTYEDGMGKELVYKSVYFNLKDGSDAHEVSAKLMDSSEVASVTLNKDMAERISQMMQSLNYIVLVVILSAAALAFIVLYNLTNINITERIREIATIKVLGFFRNETSAYVFRENRVLTGIGIAAGLVLGVFLHRFVMSQIRVDMVSFKVYIAPLSYVCSIVLTFIFNALVNLVMSARLERINMAESLKSVD